MQCLGLVTGIYLKKHNSQVNDLLFSSPGLGGLTAKLWNSAYLQIYKWFLETTYLNFIHIFAYLYPNSKKEFKVSYQDKIY